MSNVLGEPNFTPSNMSGRSGVGSDQLGYMGRGLLNTIEEGEGAFNAGGFYYTKDVAYFQGPSVQRSHNDDKRSIAILTFNGRGQATMTRRWMNMGPVLLHLQLPISYAWSGCEYVARDVNDGFSSQGTNPKKAVNGARFLEVPGCSTLLPTSFQSEGFGFAAFTNVDIDLGGGGRITYDRYANFAAIMASCMFESQRRELMRLAGGGLDLRANSGVEKPPVLWGTVDGYTASGNNNHIDIAIFGDVVARPIRRRVPVMWDIIVPFKTPDTNFTMSRKPLDTSCLAGDLMYTFTWANLFEYTDTGVGEPNAPVYFPLQANDSYFSATGGGGGTPKSFILPYVPELCRPDRLGPAFSAPVKDYIMQAMDEFLTDAVMDTDTYPLLSDVIAANPVVWTNHYRVASGRVLTAADGLGFRGALSTAANGLTIDYSAGRPRYPQAVKVNDVDSSANDRSQWSGQGAASDINDVSAIVYPNGFSFGEILNSSLKLTNVSLGARQNLVGNPKASIYYPFTYFYTQIYRIQNHPFSGIVNWNTTTVGLSQVQPERLYSDQNKITQLIQMPANPVTTIIAGIYREKDRKYLGKNVKNSYSPVLFWNALTPLRATLWDGGNILFDYISESDYSLYTQIDRPDPLFVPFKGGLVKVSEKGVYTNSGSSAPMAGWTQFGGIYNGTAMVHGGRQLTDLVSTTANLNAPPYLSAGVTNTGLEKRTGIPKYNSYPLDNVEVMTMACADGVSNHQSCHLTEMYRSCLLEFPLVFLEPVVREDIVQSTPSFAKTQLKMDFWISPTLKPDNGLDDQYDLTYGVTRGAASGMVRSDFTVDGDSTDTVNVLNKYSYPSCFSHPVPDCLRLGVNASDPELTMRDTIGSTTNPAVGDAVPSIQNTYNNAFDFSRANSWNINNGTLLLHVTFGQNQIWTQSPIFTNILSARG